MITENLSTLKIHKLTQEQYDRELAAGNIDETALYLTPDSGIHIASKTGESPVLNDSVAGGLKIDRICGWSKQETTSGKQLLDMSGAKGGTSGGITVTVNDDGSYSYVGTATSSAINVWLLGDYGTTATLFTLSAGNYYIKDVVLFSYNGTTMNEYAHYFKLTEDTPITAVRAISAFTGTIYNKTLYPMLNAGTEALPWEPYTGNIPSPNPEYPQPIVSAGQMLVDGVVSDVGISKKLTGKNLLKNTAKSKTVNGVTFTVNNNKSITISGTNDNTNVSDLYIYGSANDNGNYLNIPKGSIVSFEGIQKSYVELICREKETVTYNLEQLTNLLAERDCQFYGIFLRVKDGVSANTTIYPMIRHADIEDDTYEPYTEQTLTLNHVLRGIPLGTDIPEMFKSNALHMDGIYWNEKEQQYYIADTIDAERGVLVQRILYDNVCAGNVSISGDSNWYDSEKSYSYEIKYYKNGGNTFLSQVIGLCTHFESYTFSNFFYKSIEGGIMNNQPYVVVNIPKELGICATVDEFKSWCMENDVKIAKVLATPIETPLTDEEIIALHQLKTYQGVTHIFGSNDPDATMIFKYSSSEIGGVTLENSNLHAVNEVLRRRMLTHSDVVDNLASTDADVPLSANQGRVLKDELDDLKDEIPDVLPINKGGTGATDADTALANLGGVKASETIKTAFYDDAAENIGQLLDAKCAHARELNAPAVCIYGGWQNIDFGVFYAQVVNNVVQGIYVKGDTAYIVRCDNGTDTATYSKVALQSDIDEDIPYKVVIDDTAGTIDFIDR